MIMIFEIIKSMIMNLSPTFLKNWSIPKYKKMVLIVNKMHYFKIISEDLWHPHLLPRVWKWDCFFGYLAFSVPLIFHHCLEVLQILTCNVHSYPLSSKCSFVCHTNSRDLCFCGQLRGLVTPGFELRFPACEVKWVIHAVKTRLN